MGFRLCERRFRSVKAFSAFRATFSLEKRDISARKTRFRICGRRFRLIKSFSHFHVTFSLGYSIFRYVDAFSAFRATFSLGKHVFVRKTRISSIIAFSRLRFRTSKRFRFCERRFRSVKAFSNLRGSFSL